MKKKIPFAAAVAAVVLLSSCATDKTEAPVVTEQTSAATTAEMPQYAEFTATLENAPDKESYSEMTPDFLSDEQKKVWEEAYYMTSASVTGASFGLTGEYENSPRETEDGNEYHYMRTGISYDSMKNYILTAFTEKYADEVFLGNTYINDNGELLFLDRAREKNISYREGTFRLVSENSDEIRFAMTAYYSWDGIAQLGPLDSGETYSHYEEHFFTMVKTENGWRFGEFEFWM